ncbi:FAD-dependent thymidylate synthase [Candidatus Parcubacteria bacterium]|nr:FAD-dependent thymidylate synthase [Patescibacteria group bacterium]MBU4309161.1 FAD-dependent thymidylate synthase [Patescibacteria group bacterium]MBU4432684.1 FAD-dependent thymidylate synthase [Patescibacteria group bacterium]MBU4577522.1 FAD-dependent thymidylate synthase [Patescibacteria group bacterium]MCG2697209.1 FAD-dependent thymidylate synthase [Candidatus Parcubacteria bacterium]
MEIKLLPPEINNTGIINKLINLIVDFLIGLKTKLGIDNPNNNPLTVVSHAALKCYQAISPIWGKRIDERGRLFDTSHHTTFQHASSYFTFDIEKIAISDITFGLHLASPFYNSDQRSGRYCAKMFLEPNYELIDDYIAKFWPEVSSSDRTMAINFVKFGVEVFHTNIEQATKTAVDLIKSERPFAKGIEATAAKIAQEQMRMFISLIFPTGMDFTVNLTALAAMRLSAWTPGMRYATDKMAELIIAKHPELAYVFAGERKDENWTPELHDKEKITFPKFQLFSVTSPEKFVMPVSRDMHPIDTLHFQPKYMDNSVCRVKTQVKLSAATMGQDQRHRTISRAKPAFTGDFYMPPILSELKLEKAAEEVMTKWLEMKNVLPATLWAAIAPYGAMLTYEKDGSANAVAHEQGKRLCFCAQEEIYNLGRLEREAIKQEYGADSELLKIFEPPCYRTGICAEGARYCGRDLRIRNEDNFFPERKI